MSLLRRLLCLVGAHRWYRSYRSQMYWCERPHADLYRCRHCPVRGRWHWQTWALKELRRHGLFGMPYLRPEGWDSWRRA